MIQSINKKTDNICIYYICIHCTSIKRKWKREKAYVSDFTKCI